MSIDTSQTRSDTAPTRSDTPNWRFRQLRRVGRVYRVSIVSNSDTLTLLTRPTRLATHVSPHKSPRMPTAKLGMQPMGLLGGSNPWPWPFGTTTPSTSAVGRHPDTSDTSDTQTLDTQTRSDTTHASQLSRALRHRLDTGQTPLTLLTPVSIDTAQTRLRHCSDTPDTSDTQTQQGSTAMSWQAWVDESRRLAKPTANHATECNESSTITSGPMGSLATFERGCSALSWSARGHRAAMHMRQ